jgi:hypothetical protein
MTDDELRAIPAGPYRSLALRLLARRGLRELKLADTSAANRLLHEMIELLDRLRPFQVGSTVFVARTGQAGRVHAGVINWNREHVYRVGDTFTMYYHHELSPMRKI